MEERQLSPRENALIAYKHGVPAYIPTLFTDITMIQANPSMERYCGSTSGVDGFGVEWTYVENAHAPMTTPGKILFDEISDWREYVNFPDLEKIDWEKQADIDVHTDFMALVAGAGLVPMADGKSAYDEDKLVLCMVINGPFERLHALMGFENALIALATEPEECYEYFKAVADWKIEYFKKIAKYYKVDVINGHDDYGSKDRMFMSPDTWRKLIKPHLKRMVEACHESGVLYQHHSCGHIEPILEDLVEIGVDAIDTLQGGSNKNLVALKKEFGDRITFCGGFDNQGVLELPDVTEDEIKAEYRRVVDGLAPAGSFVVFPITIGFDYVV
ncbi:uroporphyrinogen decarboxylase family protein [Eubacteriaceae bacterium ES3]|nr:uroporphyrinogen decarboxylase family protein [Eubacteriaceae bacterium ES3]